MEKISKWSFRIGIVILIFFFIEGEGIISYIFGVPRIAYQYSLRLGGIGFLLMSSEFNLAAIKEKEKTGKTNIRLMGDFITFIAIAIFLIILPFIL